MAVDLPLVLEESCESGVASIRSEIRLLQIIATLLNTSMASTDTLLAAACESGIASINSPIVLLQIIAEGINGGGSGGDVQRVFNGAGDPNGVTTATKPAVYYGDDGTFWVKDTAGPDDTGWVKFLG